MHEILKGVGPSRWWRIHSHVAAALLGIAWLNACTSTGVSARVTPIRADTTPPPVRREARGLWIATVNNTDWPSKSGLTADQQKAELTAIFDRAAAIGINIIVFQVRPAATAVYRSEYEPWAELLTGVQGQDPGYDPLEFAIREAHARGMELHAWINPFRVGNARDSLALAANQVFRTQRGIVRVYGSSLWLDPGEPAAHDFSMRAIMDIVRRYDVDGIHADDYFYPYVQNDSAGKPIQFPDSATFARSGNGLSVEDWRRANIDRFVERLYRESHALKPGVKVGLSPFGIWRPGNPSTITGLDAYNSIYADSRKWLQSGWVDYLAPQLYWAIDPPQQSYPVLLDWWLSQNTQRRHLWPGLAVYRVYASTRSLTPGEIPRQIRLTRERPGGTGHILYNTTSVVKRGNGALGDSLAGLYQGPALVPAFPWLGRSAPLAPTLTYSANVIRLTPANGEAPRWWVMRFYTPRGWMTLVRFGDQRAVDIGTDVERVLVQGVDQAGNAGAVAEWRRGAGT